MGSILSVVSGKGGPGKTTLVTCVAVYLRTEQYSVAVVDSDPNGDFSEWMANVYSNTSLPQIKTVTEKRPDAVVEVAQELAEKHDVVLIDTAGFENQAAVMAIGTSDGVLIPAGCARKELIEADKALRLVTQLSKGSRRTIHAKVVLVGYKPRTEVGRFTRRQVEEMKLPMSAGYLSDRVAYIDMTHSGAVPVLGGTERMEISAIVDQLREEGWLPPEPLARAS